MPTREQTGQRTWWDVACRKWGTTNLSGLLLEYCELLNGRVDIVLGQLLSLGDLFVSLLAEVLLGLESGVGHGDGMRSRAEAFGGGEERWEEGLAVGDVEKKREWRIEKAVVAKTQES